jgi:glycosyltransferase involved in cell wall biosynthesis
MRIAINTLALYKTKVGMGRYIVELVNRVPKQDTKNKYLIYVSEKNRKFFTCSEENITIKLVPKIFSSPIGKIIWEQLFLLSSLQKNKIDLYHGLGFVLPLWKRSKTKFLVTIADMTFFSHPQHHTFLKQVYFRFMIPRTLKNADKIITISKNTKNDILSHLNINAKKIENIYLAADSIFRPQKKEVWKKIKEKYQIKNDYILFVGMLEPRKNIPGIIKAKDLTLVIVGKKGWLYEEIFALVKSLKIQDQVIFTGYVPDEDLPALYKGAKCFVYPSFYEGFGIPIIEAMACGCPVITSKNSSMEEIANAAAITIDPNQPEAIAEAIKTIINNDKEREKMKKLGILHAKKFTWDTMARETMQLYNTMNNNVDKVENE